jgi:hypothetical protein
MTELTQSAFLPSVERYFIFILQCLKSDGVSPIIDARSVVWNSLEGHVIARRYMNSDSVYNVEEIDTQLLIGARRIS